MQFTDNSEMQFTDNSNFNVRQIETSELLLHDQWLLWQVNNSKFLLSSPRISWLHNCRGVELGVLNTCKALIAVRHSVPGTPLQQQRVTHHMAIRHYIAV